MAYEEIKNVLGELFSESEIKLYDKFPKERLSSTKLCGILDILSSEISDSICTPSCTHRLDRVTYKCNLKITGENLNPITLENLRSTIAKNKKFFNTKCSEISLSTNSRVPCASIIFEYISVTNAVFEKKPLEVVFQAYGIYGLVKNFEIHSEIYLPKLSLTTGKAYFGNCNLVGKKIILEGKIYNLSASSITSVAFSSPNVSREIVVGSSTYVLSKLLKLDVISHNGFTAQVRLEGYIE